jgi:hypothetical protein
LIVRFVNYPDSGAPSANVNRQGWQELFAGKSEVGGPIGFTRKDAGGPRNFRPQNRANMVGARAILARAVVVRVQLWWPCNLTELEGKR